MTTPATPTLNLQAKLTQVNEFADYTADLGDGQTLVVPPTDLHSRIYREVLAQLAAGTDYQSAPDKIVDATRAAVGQADYWLDKAGDLKPVAGPLVRTTSNVTDQAGRLIVAETWGNGLATYHVAATNTVIGYGDKQATCLTPLADANNFVAAGA